MSEDYCNFACFIPLPSEEAIDSCIQLLQTAAEADPNDAGDLAKLPRLFRQGEDLITDFRCFEFEATDDGIFINSTAGGHRAAAVFIQHVLRLYYADDHFAFQWATDSSNVSTEAYRGGAYVITAKHIKSLTTCEWVDKKTEKLKGRLIGGG